MKISIDHEKIFSSSENKNTIVIKFYGTKAYTANHNTTIIILQKKLGLLAGEIEKIYRFESPGIFYAKISQEGVKKIKESFIDYDGYQASISMLNRNQRATLHWARSEMSIETIKEITAQFLNKEHKIHNITDNQGRPTDKWGILHEDGETIPHYIQLDTVDQGGNQVTHTLMLTVPGRRQVCRHCGSADHWTSVCPTRFSNTNQGKKKKATPTEETTTTESQQKPAPKEDATTKTTTTEAPTPTKTTEKDADGFVLVKKRKDKSKRSPSASDSTSPNDPHPTTLKPTTKETNIPPKKKTRRTRTRSLTDSSSSETQHSDDEGTTPRPQRIQKINK